MRVLLVVLVLLVSTPLLGGTVLVAAALGVRDRAGGIYDWCARLWCRLIMGAAGVDVVVHGDPRGGGSGARIFVSNHVSWFDPPALMLAGFARTKFVAKAELFRIPLFGKAARAVGTVYIERDNRKAAFSAYQVAAERIREGSSVVVFPEGTRGRSYALRPFKKGPFVLAIAAQAPVVPVIVHGTIDVNPRGSFRVRAGRVDIHLLEPVSTAGLGYDDRNVLAQRVWTRMADAMREQYGVESSAPSSSIEGAA